MVFLRTVSDISLILYFLTDHPMYFNAIGLVTYEKKFLNNIDYLNNVFWLVNSVLDIVVTIVDILQIQK